MDVSFGWIPDLYEIASANERYGIDSVKNVVGRSFTEGKDKKLPWEIEEERLGSIFPSWNQANIGSCVGQGASRCFQDSLLYEMEEDKRDRWPGEMPSEVAYGGSRVEIGGGRLGNSDGSLGTWAAQYLKQYGLFPRADYGGGTRDLTKYTVPNCRHWGNRGVPDDLEPLAKEHGIADFAMIQSMDDCLAAWEQGYIGTYVGGESYQTRRGANGICRRTPGGWAHQQYYRGIVWLKGNQPVLLLQNSWGDYLGDGNNRVILESGKEIILPEGCYCVVPEDANRQFRSGDSHVYNNVTEWESKRPSWKIRWRISSSNRRR